MNTFLNGLVDATNITRTENGALTHKTTKSDLLDMFAMGAAMRTRSDEDVILMFKKAYTENPVYALKCLFYIRDVRGGQGERRFFRVITKWLASYDYDAMYRNLMHIPEYGRWDDLLVFIGTPMETAALEAIKQQLALDVQCKTPSLLAKWMPSENTSSYKTRAAAHTVRQYLGMTSKQYRKTLSILRARINVLERLMSAGRWDEIEFDKIPSRAGMIYKNAFARHDLERAKNENVQSYADFAKDTSKKVNAKALYPYECVSAALDVMGRSYGWARSHSLNRVALDDTQRLMVNKYWDNLEDYFKDAVLDGMCIADTSGSMCGNEASAPINVALSIALYCAERARGPFAGHFMTFSNQPSLIKAEGVDFCDKVARMQNADWGGSTNIEASFDLLLETALRNHCSQDDLPKSLIIVSDMEFNMASSSRWYGGNDDTLFERIKQKWAAHGYVMPKLTFWNVQARQNNIPMKDDGNVNYVSGMSPVIFEQIMKGLTAYDLMMDKLDSSRYSVIH